MEIECEGFTFTTKFDGANLSEVEHVPKNKNVSNGKQGNSQEVPDYEFNLWTKLDCAGTEFENGNRTWFYFGIKGGAPFALIKLNIINLNKQTKLFSEGMCPVYKIVPGKTNWERIHDKPTFTMENKKFIISFKYRTLENIRSTTYFAFTYPHTYTDLQNYLNNIDIKCENYNKQYEDTKDLNTIYYHRECAIKSLEQRRMDLITITSHHGITNETEIRLKHLFPDINTKRCHKFNDKKIIFVSARVHPGETPSTFVLNGMINFLIQPNDPTAQLLRKMFVFKFIPSLNPDGMAHGHYRTDTRGVNLNRVYLDPSLIFHPTIYAAKSLILYYHNGYEDVDDDDDTSPTNTLTADTWDESANHSPSPPPPPIADIKSKVSILSLADSESSSSSSADTKDQINQDNIVIEANENILPSNPIDSGIFLYLDLHGHASKKGVFMYGNHFDNLEDNIECMLLPKIMSLNNVNFHFTSSNFTKRNMYLRDRRDGMSREGSGRVAVMKLTGLIHSYTLECNYNTGKYCNNLPPSSKDTSTIKNSTSPPKYTPQIFEEVGKALAISILDLAGANPWSRIRSSEYRNLQGVKDWLRRYILYEYNNPSNRTTPQRKNNNYQVNTTSGDSSNNGMATATTSSTTTTRIRKIKTTTLTPLVVNKSRTCEILEKKENLLEDTAAAATTSLSNKIKCPMSPRENIELPSCSSSGASSIIKNKKPLQNSKQVQKTITTTTNKALANNNGRTKRSTTNTDNKLKLLNDKTASGVQMLKQGPKRLKISSNNDANNKNDWIISNEIKSNKSLPGLPSTSSAPTPPSAINNNKIIDSSKLVRQNKSSQLRASSNQLSPIKTSLKNKKIKEKRSKNLLKNTTNCSFKILPSVSTNDTTSNDNF